MSAKRKDCQVVLPPELKDYLAKRPVILIIGAEPNEPQLEAFCAEHPEYQIFSISNQSSTYDLHLAKDCLENCFGLSFNFNLLANWVTIRDILVGKVESIIFDSATVDWIDGPVWKDIIMEAIYPMLVKRGFFYFPIQSYVSGAASLITRQEPFWLSSHYPVFIANLDGPTLVFSDGEDVLPYSLNEPIHQIFTMPIISKARLSNEPTSKAKRPSYALKVTPDPSVKSYENRLIGNIVAGVINLSFFRILFGSNCHFVVTPSKEVSDVISTRLVKTISHIPYPMKTNQEIRQFIIAQKD